MKKISMIVATFMVMIALTGCSEKAYKDYSEAVAKTYEEKMGKTSFRISTNVEFDKSELSVEEITQISRLSDMQLDITYQYDMTSKSRIAADIYTNTGGVGMDSSFYKDGDKEFIRLPIIKKYVVLEPQQPQQQINVFVDVSRMWIEMLEEDDVVKGENTIIDSEDGQVKAKVMTVTISDKQLEALGKKVKEMLIKQGVMEKVLQIGNQDSEGFIDTLKKSMEKVALTSLTLKAYIDFDGYLIKEEYVVGLDVSKSHGNIVESIDILIEKENWDMGKKQHIVIPEIGDDEQIQMEDLRDADMFLGL